MTCSSAGIKSFVCRPVVIHCHLSVVLHHASYFEFIGGLLMVCLNSEQCGNLGFIRSNVVFIYCTNGVCRRFILYKNACLLLFISICSSRQAACLRQSKLPHIPSPGGLLGSSGRPPAPMYNPKLCPKLLPTTNVETTFHHF
jgi:hypothetical protein